GGAPPAAPTPLARWAAAAPARRSPASAPPTARTPRASGRTRAWRGPAARAGRAAGGAARAPPAWPRTRRSPRSRCGGTTGPGRPGRRGGRGRASGVGGSLKTSPRAPTRWGTGARPRAVRDVTVPLVPAAGSPPALRSNIPPQPTAEGAPSHPPEPNGTPMNTRPPLRRLALAAVVALALPMAHAQEADRPSREALAERHLAR